MNNGFISDSDIDKILGRLSEKSVKSQNTNSFENKNHVEEKASLRGEQAKRQAMDFASSYAKPQPIDKDSKNVSFFNNEGVSAGFIRKTYAFISDLLVVGIFFTAIVYGSIYFFGPFASSAAYTSQKVSWALASLYIFMFLVYTFYFEALCGQTLGKMFLNIKIVGQKNVKPKISTIAKRILIFMVLPLGILGFHNLMTGTRLVMSD